MIAAIIGREDDLIRFVHPLVGDVKEVHDPIEQEFLAFLHRNILLHHHHAVRLPARGRPIVEFGDLLRAQSLVLELTGHDHSFLDIVRPLPRGGLDLVVGGPTQGMPGAGRQILGDGLQVGQRLEAEDIAQPRIVVPAVQVLRLRELGVSPQQDAAKAAAEAHRRGLIDQRRRPLVRRPIAGPVDDAQDFAGVGQGQHQRVITPRPVVGDVHPLLALAGGLDQEAVHVQEGLLEEGRGLVRPDLQTRVVDDVEEDLNAVRGKAATEVSRRGGVGEAAGTQGVQQDLIVAQEFEVLQASAAAQRQIGQGEHMVRFMIGEVELEQLQTSVQRINEAKPACEGMNETDAAAGHAAVTLGDLIVNVAGRHHGLGATAKVLLVQTPLNPALAVGQFSLYVRFHSKSLRATDVGESRYFIQHRKCPGISSFSE